MPDPAFHLDPRLAASSLSWRVIDGWLDVRVADDSRWPWLLLVPMMPDIVELDDMSAGRCVVLFECATRATQALRQVSGAPKTNVAAIGNVVAQFHLHIVARTPNDPNWPAPIWGFGTPTPYQLQAARAFMAALDDAWNDAQ